MQQTVYVNFQKNVQVHTQKVTVGQVASVWCKDKHITARMKAIAILRVPDVKSRRYVVSVLKVIEKMVEECPEAEINALGAPEFIISYKKQLKEHPIWQWAKIAFISLIVFCGGMFAIMAYANDIDINSIFSYFSRLLTGSEQKGLFLLQISYSIGLTGGIILFYNHFGSRKMEKDPTPLEVQMRVYEEDLDNAVIDNSARKGKEDDVD